MNRYLLLATMTFFAGSSYGSEFRVDALPEHVFAKSSGSKPVSVILEELFISNSRYVQTQLQANPLLGTEEDMALQLPITDEQITRVNELLVAYKKIKNPNVFIVKFWEKAEPRELAEIIQNTYALGIDALFEAAVKKFLQKIRDPKCLINFMQNPEWLGFNFSAEVQRLLGRRLLLLRDQDTQGGSNAVPDDLTRILACLSCNLPAREGYRLEHLLMGPGDRLLLATSKAGSDAENSDVCEIWDASSRQRKFSVKAADLSDSEGSLMKGFFCKGPEIALQSENAVRLLSLLPQDHALSAQSDPFISSQALSIRNLGKANRIWGSCMSPDSQWIAVGINDGIIVRNAWHTKKAPILLLEQTPLNPNLDDGEHILFTPDGSALIEMRSNGKIRFWAFGGENEGGVFTADAHDDSIVKFVVTKHNFLLTLDKTGMLCRWNVSSAAINTAIEKQHSESREETSPLCGLYAYDMRDIREGLAFNSNGRRVVFACNAGAKILKIVDDNNAEFDQKEQGQMESYPEVFLEACYHPEDKILATAMKNNSIVLWDADNQLPLVEIPFDRPGKGLLFSSEGDFLMRPLDDGGIRLLHFTNARYKKYLGEQLDLNQALLLKLLLKSQEQAKQANSGSGNLNNSNVNNNNNNNLDAGILEDVMSLPQLREIRESLDREVVQLLGIEELDDAEASPPMSSVTPKSAVDIWPSKPQVFDGQEKGVRDPKPDKISGMRKGSVRQVFSQLLSADIVTSRPSGFQKSSAVLSAGSLPCWGRDIDGYRILHGAAQNNFINLIKYLLSNTFATIRKQAGVEIDVSGGEYNWTPLHIACAEGHLDMVKILIELGAKIDVVTKLNSTPLHIAARYGHAAVVEYLSSLPDFASLINAEDGEGWTALHWAAYKGHREIVRLLVGDGTVEVGTGKKLTVAQRRRLELEAQQAPANPSNAAQGLLFKRPSQAETTPAKTMAERRLQAVAAANVSEIVADKTKKNKAGETAFDLATDYQIKQLVALIKLSKEEQQKLDSALKKAAEYGQIDDMETLLSAGANINFVPYYAGHGTAVARTALHRAVCDGRLRCVQFLIERGADLLVRDSDGKTALDLAAQRKDTRIFEYLQSLTKP